MQAIRIGIFKKYFQTRLHKIHMKKINLWVWNKDILGGFFFLKNLPMCLLEAPEYTPHSGMLRIIFYRHKFSFSDDTMGNE